MRSGWKKATTFILALLILVSTVPSYAATGKFKDVASSHWAYKPIEDMASLGFLNGYPDGTFQPERNLLFIETMSALLKFLNPSKAEIVEFGQDYAGLFYDLDIKDVWKKEALSVALKYDVISDTRLRLIVGGKNLDRTISRADFSEYLVKAMGLEGEANNQKIFSLPFVDTESIQASQHKYINVLLKAGVLHPDGKGNKMFKPKDPLTRAEMAKMLAVSYEYLLKNPGLVETKPEELKKVEGKISKITEVANRQALIITDLNKLDILYYLDSKSLVKIDGKTGSYLDLAVNQDVTLRVRADSYEIVEIEAKSLDEEIQAKIKSIRNNESKLVVEYEVNKKLVTRELLVDKDSRIFLDGLSATLRDLREGNFGVFWAKNGLIYDADLLSLSKKVEGIVKEIAPIKDSRDREYYIKVEDKKENIHEFIINSKTTIYRNDKRVSDIEEIKLKDEIYIDGDYDFNKEKYVAHNIDAYVVIRRIKGVIVAINSRLHQKTELTIVNQESKKEEKYILGKDVYIRIDGQVTNSYDLKTGYYLDIKTEADEIVEIDGDTRGVERTALGKITAINYRTYALTIELQDFSLESQEYGEELNVYIKTNDKDKTIIVNRNFTEIGFDNLRKGDIINIVGSYDGSSFVADTIQLR